MTVVPAGLQLSRVYSTGFSSTSFNPTTSDPLFGGSRFDSTASDPYSYLYAGENDSVAIAETLLRDIPADDRGGRFLPRASWRGRTISRVQTTAALSLVSLASGADLAAIGQDTWLTWCDPDDYPQTRAWAHWLRAIESTCMGLVWHSKREPGKLSYVLFEDRCPVDLLDEMAGPFAPGVGFDDPLGSTWLRDELRPYRVSIRI